MHGDHWRGENGKHGPSDKGGRGFCLGAGNLVPPPDTGGGEEGPGPSTTAGRRTVSAPHRSISVALEAQTLKFAAVAKVRDEQFAADQQALHDTHRQQQKELEEKHSQQNQVLLQQHNAEMRTMEQSQRSLQQRVNLKDILLETAENILAYCDQEIGDLKSKLEIEKEVSQKSDAALQASYLDEVGKNIGLQMQVDELLKKEQKRK